MKNDSFYKLPKKLFFDERYKHLSISAKVLYALLLDRKSLSIKNNWVDTDGNYYLYFTNREAKELLNCGSEKVCKLFKELERVNLILRRRQGLKRPNIIYVYRIWDPIIKLQEFRLSNTNKNDDSKTMELLLAEKINIYRRN